MYIHGPIYFILDLAVLQAFPCRSGLGDKDSAARVEDEVDIYNLFIFIFSFFSAI